MKTFSTLVFFLTISLSTLLLGQNVGIKIDEKFSGIDIQLKDVKGNAAPLIHFKGEKGLLVIFSCNTCPFVVGMKDGSFPGWERQYNDLYAKAKQAGLEMILVNSNEGKRDGEDSPKEMAKRQEEMGYKMKYLIDNNSELANQLAAKTTPHVFLFDADFTLKFMGSIDNSWDPKRKTDEFYLLDALKQLEGKIKVTESEPRGCSIKRTTQK